ncbi:MAG: WYL domain-containing protein, partial [Duncaniella sp.]|nr:WYL domain-containing protein [Duncaniella sp.]
AYERRQRQRCIRDRVVLRADARQSKYLRTLPLHHSQREVLHDDYSLFYYRLRLTPDFVQEILSRGPSVRVVSPPELRAMVVTSLKDSLRLYGE